MLTENMLIIFKQGAPADLEDYCFIHRHGELTTALQVKGHVELIKSCLSHYCDWRCGALI